MDQSVAEVQKTIPDLTRQKEQACKEVERVVHEMQTQRNDFQNYTQALKSKNFQALFAKD